MMTVNSLWYIPPDVLTDLLSVLPLLLIMISWLLCLLLGGFLALLPSVIVTDSTSPMS